MSEKKWMKWFCVGLLVTGCVLTTGCGGGDDDNSGGGGVIVVTNFVVVPGPGGTTMTNLVVETNAPANDPAHPPIVETALVAPELIDPPNGASYSTGVDTDIYPITFEWAAVPGAVSYILEVNGRMFTTSGTTMDMRLIDDDYIWNVRAKKSGAGLSGPPSETRTFTITFGP